MAQNYGGQVRGRNPNAGEKYVRKKSVKTTIG